MLDQKDDIERDGEEAEPELGGVAGDALPVRVDAGVQDELGAESWREGRERQTIISEWRGKAVSQASWKARKAW